MSEPPGATKRLHSAVLAAILAAGIALRLVGVVHHPFEQDELYTAIEARLLYDSPLHPGIHARPLYYLLQHPLLAVWPVSHVSLRLLPFLFGLLGIIATWYLARRVAGHVAAHVSAILAVLSPWHLYVSGMARYWSLVYLLSAVFCALAIRAYSSDRRSDYYAALFALLAGAFTHPTFLFLSAGVAASFALVDFSRLEARVWRRPWIHLWIPAGAVMSVALLALTLSGEESSLRNWGGRGMSATLTLVPALAEWITPALGIAGVCGASICMLDRLHPDRRRLGAITIVGGAATLVLLLVSSMVTDVYVDYAVGLLPLIVVSAGCLVAMAIERMASGAIGYGLALTAVLAAGLLPSTVSFLSDGNRFDYRPAFDHIRTRNATTPVLSAPIVLQRHYAPALRGRELPFDRDSLERILQIERQVWIVAAVRRNGIWLDARNDLAAWLPERCRLITAHERRRFDYRLYRTELHYCDATTRPGL